MKSLIFSLLIISNAFAVSIKDYPYYNYDVFFTNPDCKEYFYDEPVQSFNGEELISKPKNVYCKRADAKKNELREDSPHYQLKKLISSNDINKISMAYLSFSNSDIIETLCETTIKKNNVKFNLIVDKGSKKDSSKLKKINYLKNCKPAKKYYDAGIANEPEIFFRGQVSGLGYAHNKIIFATYKSLSDKVTIVFSSANMSSGTTLHHENWHFLTTSLNSYLAQGHQCILEGMKNHAKSIRANQRLGRERKTAIENFKAYINLCREQIETKEEDDIKLFIVPSDGKKAMNNIVSSIGKAKKISVAVHRFTHPDLKDALQKAGKNKNQDVRFVADDDIFWAGEVNRVSSNYIQCSPTRNPQARPVIGANMCNEYFNVQSLIYKGVEVKYMQTNQNLFLLHHNKYIIFDFEKEQDAVHCGAGNFTQAAFSKNFENYYYITIPEIVEEFKQQYDHVWNDLATKQQDMPKKMVMP